MVVKELIRIPVRRLTPRPCEVAAAYWTHGAFPAFCRAVHPALRVVSGIHVNVSVFHVFWLIKGAGVYKNLKVAKGLWTDVRLRITGANLQFWDGLDNHGFIQAPYVLWHSSIHNHLFLYFPVSVGKINGMPYRVYDGDKPVIGTTFGGYRIPGTCLSPNIGLSL